MSNRLRSWWASLRGSFWFLPAWMTLAAAGLAMGAVALDRTVADPDRHLFGWTYHGGPDGARGVLGAIASSMISVAGTVFSITMVALTLASQQFGPRLIRNFTRDRSNQFVLGTFVATFVYCLLVLRTVNGTEGAAFVPELGVTGGVALALLSLGVLIYYIHHAAVSIQVSRVIERVGKNLASAMDHLYPDEVGQPVPAAATPGGDPPATARPVRAAVGGYVTSVDADTVQRVAEEHDLTVFLPLSPGRHVACGGVVAWIDAAAGRAVDAAATAVGTAVAVGPRRTTDQDFEYELLQLTEIAVRDINDPFTAVECVDRLALVFADLAARRLPSPWRSGADGRPRVYARRPTFPELLAAAFDPIRHHGRGSPLVLASLADAFATVAAAATRPADREAVGRHAEQVRRAADELPEPDDRTAIRNCTGAD
ncbi:DUF2254 domain-containing protein [Limnoglobus roseus]|uniref:DUF2254 domain-containing protein n=1 Tax=Limnoglobus roseus TaxID=2598579 RepID=A0A5C1AIB7_9BACT|nr:DUF2254 domain-containing protein [Limnoglobus roseus]QEL17746.1 hypothetical protein PX52LOC_04750 [Limnoglobus roseus]